MHGILRKSAVLVVIGSFVILCGFPSVLTDYTYVDLEYLANHLPDYSLMSVNTTGINVSAIVVYDSLWQCYYLEVEYWGPAIEWNPADINFDLKVDIFDCITIAVVYGSKLGDINWNHFADINNDGIVDIFDALVVAANYGRQWVP